MRTVIDIPDDQVETLDRLAVEAGQSRAALIRQALQQLISSRLRARDPKRFFGLWAPAREDGLAFQERMRAEWPD